jgi:putative transcriptional regulator
MSNTVSIRLNDILRERHMTKQQLALLTGLRPSTISDLCKPTASRIYLSTIAVLCATLNISVEELIVLEPNESC